MQSLWLPAIQAQLAINRKDTSTAIDLLQAALPPVEYGRIQFVTNISCLYPTYIRGEAYVAAGQGKEAAAKVQKILDHSRIVWNCWRMRCKRRIHPALMPMLPTSVPSWPTKI